MDRTQPGQHLCGHRVGIEKMKTVLYCRVSTLDQNLEHQRVQAEQAGFKPDLILADHGVSGVSTRLCERPEGKRLFDVLREGDTLVVRWIDRLGRNYADVTDTIREFIDTLALALEVRAVAGCQDLDLGQLHLQHLDARFERCNDRVEIGRCPRGQRFVVDLTQIDRYEDFAIIRLLTW
jgi:hypothetical protein